MSSVQDITDCPRCGKKGAFIFDCGTSDEWFQCYYCGYAFYTKTTVDKENGSEENSIFTTKEYETKGFGSYCIVYRHGPSPFGILNKPIDEETISWFRKCLEDPNVDPNASYLTRWNEESQTVDFLVNSPESSFSELTELKVIR